MARGWIPPGGGWRPPPGTNPLTPRIPSNPLGAGGPGRSLTTERNWQVDLIRKQMAEKAAGTFTEGILQALPVDVPTESDVDLDYDEKGSSEIRDPESPARQLLIMPCSATKSPAQCAIKAAERYTGSLWQTLNKTLGDEDAVKSLNNIGVDLYVLSAKHGLISADELIEDYDQRMTKDRQLEILGDEKLSTNIRNVLKNYPDESIYLGGLGKDYRKLIENVMGKEYPQDESSPLPRGIGDKRKALKEWLQAARGSIKETGITSLPMDPASREARRVEQGYTTKTFHGTLAEEDFPEFSGEFFMGLGPHFGVNKDQAEVRLKQKGLELDPELPGHTVEPYPTGSRLLPIQLKIDPENVLTMPDVGDWDDAYDVAYALRETEWGERHARELDNLIFSIHPTYIRKDEHQAAFDQIRKFLINSGKTVIKYWNTAEVGSSGEDYSYLIVNYDAAKDNPIRSEFAKYNPDDTGPGLSKAHGGFVDKPLYERSYYG